METLGEKIKLLRNKLTQEELAALLKVERSTLASWEVNRREPDIATLCRIASFFQVSIDWLVGHDCNTQKQLPQPTSIRETAGEYRAEIAPAWYRVIATAQTYGFEPDAVLQLLELNAKLALSLKDNKQH